MNLYSIKDNKVGVFAKPFMCVNNAEATRMLHAACNDDKVQLSMYPEDFDLYHIGSMNEQTGHLNSPSENGPVFVVSAISLKKIEAKNG